MTVLCCASMTGEKEQLLVIGKNKSHLCFKGVKRLHMKYLSNSNAWMTSLIFNGWLIKQKKRLDQKLLLLVDNCIANKMDASLKT